VVTNKHSLTICKLQTRSSIPAGAINHRIQNGSWIHIQHTFHFHQVMRLWVRVEFYLHDPSIIRHSEIALLLQYLGT
jgi:hypothetical protein